MYYESGYFEIPGKNVKGMEIFPVSGSFPRNVQKGELHDQYRWVINYNLLIYSESCLKYAGEGLFIRNSYS